MAQEDRPEALPRDPDLSEDDRALPERSVRRMPRAQIAVVLAIACGGAVGAFGRYAISLALPTETGAFPRGTFLINISGAAFLGFLLVLVNEHFTRSRLARMVLGTGITGAYTTFSTFVVETDLLIHDGALGMAALYLAISLVAGTVAVFVGIALGRGVLRMERWLQEEEGS